MNGTQFKIAATLVERLERRTPNVREIAEWHYLTAFCLHNSHSRLQEALRRYDLALKYGFHEFCVRYNRGALHAQMGKFEDARADLLRATLLRPDHAGARQILQQLP